MSEPKTTDQFEDILAQNAQTGLPPIVNVGADRKAHQRRRLDWKRQARIQVGQQGDRITFAHPSNRWKKNDAGHWGHVYAMAMVQGQWRVWDVLPLDGPRPQPGGLVTVSFPSSRLDGVADGQWIALFMAGTKSSARSYVTPIKVRIGDTIPPIDQPDPDIPDSPGPDQPDDSWVDEPDTRPDFDDVELAGRFERWHGYPATLDAGDFKAVVHDDEAIDVEWSKHLGRLPRFEEGDRFGRLCWVAWDGYGGSWVGGHGEHLRIQEGVDEGAAAGMHRFADIGLDLQETLAEKSKIDDLERVELEGRLGFFVVTHDQNPNPQRTPVFWTGAPFEEADVPGKPVPDEPDDPADPVHPPDEPDPDPEPDQPAVPEPRFSMWHAPGVVDAGQTFQITWATNDATHVRLSNSRGPVAKQLPAAGKYDQRLDSNEHYTLEAVNGEEWHSVEFDVSVIPQRPSWLDLLRRLIGW